MTIEANTETLEPNALALETQPTSPPQPAVQDPPENTGGDDQQHGNKGKSPWYMKRIADEAHAKDQARAEANTERQQRLAAEEMLARLQRSQAPTGQNPPAPQPEPRAPASNDRNFDAAVNQAAYELRFKGDLATVIAKGHKDFPDDFAKTCDALGAVGMGAPAVLDDLFATVGVDQAHKVLQELAQESNLERAAALAEMDPRRRIAEFTRMADKPKVIAADPKTPATPPTKVSKAPAPAPRIEATTTTTKDWRSDDSTDAEFDEGFNEMMKKRSARR